MSDKLKLALEADEKSGNTFTDDDLKLAKAFLEKRVSRGAVRTALGFDPKKGNVVSWAANCLMHHIERKNARIEVAIVADHKTAGLD